MPLRPVTSAPPAPLPILLAASGDKVEGSVVQLQPRHTLCNVRALKLGEEVETPSGSLFMAISALRTAVLVSSVPELRSAIASASMYYPGIAGALRLEGRTARELRLAARVEYATLLSEALAKVKTVVWAPAGRRVELAWHCPDRTSLAFLLLAYGGLKQCECGVWFPAKSRKEFHSEQCGSRFRKRRYDAANPGRSNLARVVKRGGGRKSGAGLRERLAAKTSKAR
jgi:hypothetical protein